MKIEVFMLSGQNNGEKDVLRAYHRGILNYLFRHYLNVCPEETQIPKLTKTLAESHDIKVNLNYNDTCGEDVDLAVIFGSAKDREALHHIVRSSVIKNARNYIVIETPLLNRSIVKASNHSYYRTGLNGFLQDDGEFNLNNLTKCRLTTLNINTSPFKDYSEGNLLILCQLPGDASLRHSDHGEWLMETISRIRDITDRQICIRFHPAMSEKGHENFFKDIGKIVFENHNNIVWSDGKSSSLQSDFDNAGLCITYSSGSAIDAVIAGIPTIAVDAGNFAYPISSKTIDCINAPYIPTEEEREEWLIKLAHCQWNRSEMVEGDAFGHLFPKIMENIDVQD